jgi:hypothetical protein
MATLHHAHTQQGKPIHMSDGAAIADKKQVTLKLKSWHAGRLLQLAGSQLQCKLVHHVPKHAA